MNKTFLISAVCVTAIAAGVVYNINSETQSHRIYSEFHKDHLPTTHPVPPVRETVSGHYLSSRVAQHSKHWTEAADLLQRAIILEKEAHKNAGKQTPKDKDKETPDTPVSDATETPPEKTNVTPVPTNVALKLRLMTLDLGAGNFERAVKAAKEIEQAKGSAVDTPLTDYEILGFASTTLITEAFKRNDLKETKALLDSLKKGALASSLKPSFELWYHVAQHLEDKKNNKDKKINARDFRANKHNALSLIHTAYALESVGEFAKARKNLIRAHKLTGTIGTSVVLGMFYLRQDDKDKALKLFSELLEKHPEDTELTEIVAQLKDGQPSNTVKDYDTFAAHLKSPQSGLAVTLYDLAGIYISGRSNDAALIIANMGHALAPEQEPITLFISDILSTQGNQEAALEILENIPKSSSNYIDSLIKRATILEEQEKVDEAIALLTGALEEHKKALIAYNLGDIYRINGQYLKALEAYEQVPALSPDGKIPDALWSTHYFKGIVYHELDRWDEAEKQLLKALELRPDNTYVLNYLGYSWADQNKNTEKALSMLERALKMNPRSAAITDSLGWVHYKLGNYDLATKYLERATQILPYDAEINDHLGDLYWKTDRKIEAIYQWQRVVKYAKEDHQDIAESASQKLLSGL